MTTTLLALAVTGAMYDLDWQGDGPEEKIMSFDDCRECARLNNELNEAKKLLTRWLMAYPATHSVPDGNVITWVQDTRAYLGMTLLAPIDCEAEHAKKKRRR